MQRVNDALLRRHTISLLLDAIRHAICRVYRMQTFPVSKLDAGLTGGSNNFPVGYQVNDAAPR
jgi:hypothetical protein